MGVSDAQAAGIANELAIDSSAAGSVATASTRHTASTSINDETGAADALHMNRLAESGGGHGRNINYLQPENAAHLSHPHTLSNGNNGANYDVSPSPSSASRATM